MSSVLFFCSQGNNRQQFRIVFYFHVEMGAAAACVFVILFHGVCCLRFLFYVLVLAASCLGGFPYAVFKIFKVMQHGAKHSTLGSVQGVPVGGNPVVDRDVYFECGF